jgi:hypothetical protein
MDANRRLEKHPDIRPWEPMRLAYVGNLAEKLKGGNGGMASLHKPTHGPPVPGAGGGRRF